VTPEEIKQLENDLWRSADTLRANSDLKAGEYSTPVLGLIFLKFADNRYRRFRRSSIPITAADRRSRTTTMN
jgi:type I restriction enzyme M protein